MPNGPQAFRPVAFRGTARTGPGGGFSPGGAGPGAGNQFFLYGGDTIGGTEVYTRYPFATLNGSARVAVANVAPGTLVLSAPPTFRNFLGIRNSSPVAGANITLEFGNIASADSWVFLQPNELILFDASVPQDDVFAFASAAGGFVTVVQSVVALPPDVAP